MFCGHFDFFLIRKELCIMGVAYPECQDNSASDETKKIAFLGKIFLKSAAFFRVFFTFLNEERSINHGTSIF
jgi:hypothetical protein